MNNFNLCDYMSDEDYEKTVGEIAEMMFDEYGIEVGEQYEPYDEREPLSETYDPEGK